MSDDRLVFNPPRIGLLMEGLCPMCGSKLEMMDTYGRCPLGDGGWSARSEPDGSMTVSVVTELDLRARHEFKRRR